ncbi:histidinol-phosphate transaminase [Opitutales bacterium ASA1]|uniref:histidinol-phosphate transaminase n=1 Tax=Congregicoccus parvus TaxID=3081749 RepID=UPI002B2ACB71|nr:histidinol-phosphate transaminase [Opitutales bacterium ASA1]
MKTTEGSLPALSDLARPEVLTQPVYEPGKPIEDVARELGLDPGSIIKLASNENPLGASPAALEAASRALRSLELYPDGGAVRLRAKLARKLGLAPEQIAVGNGSNEILELLGHVFLGPGVEAVMGAPAFAVYKLVTLLFGGRVVEVPLVNHRHDLDALRAAVTDRTRLVFLPSPNNPTGTANDEAEILGFARSLPPHVVFVYDEAYAEYMENPPDLRPLIAEGRPVVCLRTFSKIYGLAGLRLGYGYGSREMIALLQRVRQPFNVNAVALAAGEAALDDVDFVARSCASNTAGLAQLEAGFAELGLEFVPSVANFVTVKVGAGAEVFARLQAAGVIVRPMGGYGMPEWVRVSVGTREQNDRLLAELARILHQAKGAGAARAAREA